MSVLRKKLQRQFSFARLRLVVPATMMLGMTSAFPQEPRTLEAVVVSGAASPTVLDAPAATGSNLELTPRQIPASLDVLSREQLDARGDTNVLHAITRAAGMSAIAHPGNGNSALSARGFTDSTSVMRLYDGLRQYGGVGVTFPFDTWSVERIEVLRGPASVIYGDGAIGGVINVVPKRPSRGAVENEVQMTVGTQDTARLGLGSGGSLSESVRYRLDASGNTSRGWVERGQSWDTTFSGALHWAATRDLGVTLTHAYGYQRPMRYFGTPLVDGRQLPELRRKNYNVSDSFMRFRDQWTQLDTVWTPDDAMRLRMRLYHIDSQRDWRNAERYVYTPATGLIDRSDNTAIRHDQRQHGATFDALFRGTIAGFEHTFSVGMDANHSRFRHTNNTYSGSSGPVDPYHPLPGVFTTAFPTIPRYRNEANQYAVFAESRLALTPQWSVISGARYDHAKVVRDDLVSGARALSKTYANAGWRIGTVYDVQPDTTIYAQYATAADPVSGLLMLSPANGAFDMAKGRQIEVGLKQSFWQARGEWTLSAYHLSKSNLLTRDALNPSLRVQVGKQSSRGVEASLSVALAHGWKVEANGTLLRARYDDFSEATGTPPMAMSRQGKVPPNVAQRLANLWLSWNVQPDWTFMGGLQYVGKRYADSANTLPLPSYVTTDLAVRWDMTRQTSLTARGFNIFDRAYFTTAYYTNTQWLYGPGRRFELTLTHRF